MGGGGWSQWSSRREKGGHGGGKGVGRGRGECGRGEEDNFVNFGSKKEYGKFVKNLYKFVNQIDLDPFHTDKI